MQIPEAVRALEGELREVFGTRMQSLVVYGHAGGVRAAPISTLALVDVLTADDLRRCAARTAGWHDRGLATPLLITASEFCRSLDAFPLEFGAIIADHTVVAGTDPFVGLRVDAVDLRHACEVKARGHLLHLREGYLETHGRSDAVAELIGESAAALAALLRTVARLLGGNGGDAEASARLVERELQVDDGTFREIVGMAGAAAPTSEQARQLFPRYLHAVEQLTAHVDRWNKDDAQ